METLFRWAFFTGQRQTKRLRDWLNLFSTLSVEKKYCNLIVRSFKIFRHGIFHPMDVCYTILRTPLEYRAAQYSEGCFATWDPAVAGLVANVTGSARPVNSADYEQLRNPL
jgi:hypothetical protein